MQVHISLMVDTAAAAGALVQLLSPKFLSSTVIADVRWKDLVAMLVHTLLKVCPGLYLMSSHASP